MPGANKPSHGGFCIRPLDHSCLAATDDSSMSLRTHFQPGTTIVQIHGAVAAGDAAHLSAYVDDLVSSDRPLILDLRGLDFLSCDGFRALATIAAKSQRTGVRWVLVTNEAVDRLLGVTGTTYMLPIAASVQEALQQLMFPIPTKTDRRIVAL